MLHWKEQRGFRVDGNQHLWGNPPMLIVEDDQDHA